MLMPTKSPWAPSLLGPGNAGLGQVQSLVQSLVQRRAPSSSRLPVMPRLPLQVTLRAAILWAQTSVPTLSWARYQVPRLEEKTVIHIPVERT